MVVVLVVVPVVVLVLDMFMVMVVVVAVVDVVVDQDSLGLFLCKVVLMSVTFDVTNVLINIIIKIFELVS